MMENNTEDIGTYKDVQNKLISDNQEFFILNLFHLRYNIWNSY